MKNIRLICFDLDDTLWPCMPTILKAEEAYYQWFVQHRPEIAQAYDSEALRQKRKQLGARNPELAHDMSRLRLHSLIELADEFGYSHNAGRDDWIAEAFDTFYQLRQQVVPYDDVLPVMQKLAKQYVLATATNGNADIYRTSLGVLIEHAVSPSETGLSKPHPAMFELLQQKSGFAPDQMLHVGDHPLDDIEGAQRAGITSIWMDRQQQGWQRDDIVPDYIVSNMQQLLELIPTE